MLRARNSHRREGDRHRDAREWPQAASAYERHLLDRPNDAAIWVQLGHAEKEQGHLEVAEAYYRRATELMPHDPDVYLQLGHVLKLQGRLDESIAAYEQSNKIQPTVDAALEAHKLRDTTGTLPVHSLDPGTTFFAIQDLFGYLKAHSTMSGIQRVQAGIALNAMTDATIRARFILVSPGADARGFGTFLMLDNDDLRAIIEYASGNSVDHERLRRMLGDAVATADRVRPMGGDTIVILGAFWGHGNTIDRYLASRRAGVRLVAYIYDIIPVTHPEYCDEQLAHEFRLALSELIQIVDFILTISDSTRLTLARYLEQHSVRSVPMRTVRLAHALTSATDGREEWPAALKNLKGRPYVAYISTIEGRKNHLYVVNAWQQLIAEGVDVPDLVFVGRHGWRINSLTDMLEGTRNLGGRVHIVHGLSDAEINSVYRHAMFTVFTSFVEGWGLPIGESLANKVPCVASSTSSMPEVGGDFVDYIDPYNLRDGVIVLKRMIENDEYRTQRKRFIESAFVQRNWGDVANDFVAELKAIELLPMADQPDEVWLPEGNLVPLGALGRDQFDVPWYTVSPARLMFAECFYEIEHDGAWMRGRTGQVAFRTPCQPGEEIIVYLDMHEAPLTHGRNFSVYFLDPSTRSAEQSRWRQLEARNLLRIKGPVGPGGVVTIAFEIEGGVQAQSEPDPRVFGLALVAIGYARLDRADLRQNIVEAFTFGYMDPN